MDNIWTSPDQPDHQRESKLEMLTFLYPLQLCYEAQGLALPDVEVVDSQTIPQPHQDLLVHQTDMTGALERYYGGRIVLHVLHRFLHEKMLTRQVVLELEGSNQPVEFGAIRIDLTAFEEQTQALIVAGEVPLGAMLEKHQVVHESHPQAYFRILADSPMQTALQLGESSWLFGRHNLHLDENGKTMAEIVEILPPK